MSKTGARIIEGLKEAIAGDLSSVMIEGQAWVRATELRQDQQEIMRINNHLREVLIEIANRASNMSDKDAADWMPSIYKLACDAVGEDPWPLLRAAGHDPMTLTVAIANQ